MSHDVKSKLGISLSIITSQDVADLERFSVIINIKTDSSFRRRMSQLLSTFCFLADRCLTFLLKIKIQNSPSTQNV